MVNTALSDASKLIDAYITGLIPWQKAICERLRQLIHQADPDIAEDWKWGAPAFSHNGLVCYIFTSKQWVNFTFVQGALIEDRYRLFNYGQGNDHNRSIKLTEASQIQDELLLAYLKEAVAKNLAGQKVVLKPEPKQQIVLPGDIESALGTAGLLGAYRGRPYYQQKGYLSWIGEAKQEQTKKRRIATMIEELRSGVYMSPKRPEWNQT